MDVWTWRRLAPRWQDDNGDNVVGTIQYKTCVSNPWARRGSSPHAVLPVSTPWQWKIHCGGRCLLQQKTAIAATPCSDQLEAQTKDDVVVLLSAPKLR